MIHDVHTTHCCIVHGCKYGNRDRDCTVVENNLPITGCEQCGLEESGYYGDCEPDYSGMLRERVDWFKALAKYLPEVRSLGIGKSPDEIIEWVAAKNGWTKPEQGSTE